jgi:SAM-dependent methyltransferase
MPEKNFTMLPALVASKNTAAFVMEAAPRGAGAVLDVGCGIGNVALHLVAQGYKVTGIDESRTAARRCIRRGIRAIEADFAEYETRERYDVVLFSRSLHHMKDPRRILRKAGGMLAPGGVVLIEEFAFEEVDEFAAGWLLTMLRLAVASGLAAKQPRLPAARRLALGWWKGIHHHKIHDGRTVIAAARSSLRVARLERVPYLFRYLVPELKKSAKSAAVLEHARALEQLTFAAARRPCIGIRAVCRPKH